MCLTEAEDIKRWQEYTEKLYKKDRNDPDNHDGVITHLEPDILKCEVKWVLGSITRNKASGGDKIPIELFHLEKKMATQSSMLASEIPWTEGPGRLQSMGSLKSWTQRRD